MLRAASAAAGGLARQPECRGDPGRRRQRVLPERDDTIQPFRFVAEGVEHGARAVVRVAGCVRVDQPRRDSLLDKLSRPAFSIPDQDELHTVCVRALVQEALGGVTGLDHADPRADEQVTAQLLSVGPWITEGRRIGFCETCPERCVAGQAGPPRGRTDEIGPIITAHRMTVKSTPRRGSIARMR